jgi:hypothetical protein
MKKRVRIYKPENQWKAQMGGYQATEAAAPQAQLTDEDLISATVKMLAQGSQPQEVLNSLMENGIEEQKATQAVQYSVDYIKSAQEGEYSDVEADEQAQQDAALEEAAAERQAIEAQEAEARKARMQEMYGLTEDNTTQDYSDDDQLMMDMMRYGGLPSKRTYVKNAVKLAKKQMGGQEQPATQSNRADNTDTGDRTDKLKKFVGSLQNHANEALMKLDAEAAYNQMQEQNPFMAMAQEGGEDPAAQLDPRQQRQMARQQRQMGRQMNRMIGNIPVGLYNNRGGGLPTNIGVINMPAIGAGGLQSLMSGMSGAQSMIPAIGSIPGGPKLANIDVRKTGLFGRPKQYSITFAQDVVTNPTTAENAAKQEVKNIEEEAKEVEEKVEAAAEEVKKADEATKAAEETSTKSTSGSSSKLTTAAKKKTTPVKSASYTKAQLDADAVKLVQDFKSLSSPKKFAYLNKMRNHPDFNTNPVMKVIYDTLYELSPFQDDNRTSNTSTKTYSGATYDFSNPDAAWQSITQHVPKGPQSIQSSVQLFDNYRAPYWMAKEAVFGKDTDMQQGGFTQEGSGLYKFVYGGNEMYMPAPAGKITDDPYFQYGGLKRYAEGDEVTGTSGSGTETDPTKLPEVKVTADEATTTAKTPTYLTQEDLNNWATKMGLSGEDAGIGWGKDKYGNPLRDNLTTMPGEAGYNYGYNTGVGPIYPPMFGRGRGLQNLLNFTPFGANPIATYAGTWTQQKGLPIDPATGQAYTGDFANPQIAKIDVRKSGLFGRPKKYSIDYMVDDVAGTSSFLNPEDYPGGVNPGPGGTTAPATTSDGLTIDPATGEPLPVGREIKNLKLKSFMSRIPGVRNMINWGDATEMTPEEEFRFKTKNEMERNMAAEERGDIVAPPIPEDEAAVTSTPGTQTTTAPQSTAEKDARTRQTLQMQQNMADEESGDLVAPLPPGERTTRTADERSFDVERRVEPMVEGIPEGTPEEVRNQLAEQRYLSDSSFGDYQAGPMQNIDASVAEQFGVPQSMVDQFAYQADDNTDGSVFDLSTQRGFDKQQYLNESLGREQLDVSQRPITGTLPINSLEQLYTDMTPGEIVQSPQYKADNETIIAELTKQGKPITQANIMQEFGRQQAGVQVKEWQAIEAEQRRIAAQKAAKQKAAAAAKAAAASAGTSSSGSGTKVTTSKVSSEVNKPTTASSTFKNLSYEEKQNYLKELIDLRDNSSDKAYRRKIQDLYNDLDKIYIKEWEAKQETESEEGKYQAKYKKIKDPYNFQASGLEIDDYLKLQNSGKLPTYKERDYYRDLEKRTSRQYGGMSNTPRNLYKAYDGVQTPVSGDPRFASSYEEMMRNMADEEAGLLVPPPIPGEQAPGMKQVEFGDVEGIRQNAAYSDKVFGTNYTEDYGLNKPGRKKVRVDYKNKNMWTIDPQQALNAGLMGAQGLTRFLNAGDERKREQELARSLTADNVYGTRSNMDRGTYDVNSGLFREMGFNGVVKYGGAPFKQGGTTYMSAAQVKKFLEEGGELEFV